MPYSRFPLPNLCDLEKVPLWRGGPDTSGANHLNLGTVHNKAHSSAKHKLTMMDGAGSRSGYGSDDCGEDDRIYGAVLAAEDELREARQASHRGRKQRRVFRIPVPSHLSFYYTCVYIYIFACTGETGIISHMTGSSIPKHVQFDTRIVISNLKSLSARQNPCLPGTIQAYSSDFPRVLIRTRPRFLASLYNICRISTGRYCIPSNRS